MSKTLSPADNETIQADYEAIQAVYQTLTIELPGFDQSTLKEKILPPRVQVEYSFFSIGVVHISETLEEAFEFRRMIEAETCLVAWFLENPLEIELIAGTF